MTARIAKLRLSRRTLVQALLALPAFALARRLPTPDPDPEEIVEVDGWILRREDLA